MARATGIAVGLSAASQVVIMLIGGAVAEVSTVATTFWVAVGLGVVGVAVLLPLPDHARPLQEQPPRVQALARAGTQRSTLVAAALAALLQYAQFGLTFAFVPLWADSLGASNFDLGLLATVAITANGLGALVLVGAGARLNGRLAAVVGFALTAVSSLLIPILPSLAVLIVVQGIGGFGRGLVFPALMAHSIERAAPAERATAMGVFQGVYALGMFLGPVSAGVLGEWLGLERVFVLIGALMVVGALAAVRYVSTPTTGCRNNIGQCGAWQKGIGNFVPKSHRRCMGGVLAFRPRERRVSRGASSAAQAAEASVSRHRSRPPGRHAVQRPQAQAPDAG